MSVFNAVPSEIEGPGDSVLVFGLAPYVQTYLHISESFDNIMVLDGEIPASLAT